MALRKPPKDDAQIDLFVPLFGDIASRDGIDLMELPFFSLSKKKRFKALRYENEVRGIEVIISGGEPHGIATIWDKDIIIWCISQIREALDRDEVPKREIFFHPYQLLKFIRRSHGNTDYKRLEKSCIRLANTLIYTSIRTDDYAQKMGFHWIDRFKTTTDNKTGEGVGMWSITVSDWLFETASERAQVLTIDDDYFLLTGGRERWLYLIARKHGGYQDNGYTMSMKALYEKSPSDEQYKYWAREIRKIVQEDNLPGYHLSVWRNTDTDEEFIHFMRRSKLAFSHPAYQMDTPRNIRKMISHKIH